MLHVFDDQAILGTILMNLFPERILIRKYPQVIQVPYYFWWLFHHILEVHHRLLLVWVECLLLAQQVDF